MSSVNSATEATQTCKHASLCVSSSRFSPEKRGRVGKLVPGPNVDGNELDKASINPKP